MEPAGRPRVERFTQLSKGDFIFTDTSVSLPRSAAPLPYLSRPRAGASGAAGLPPLAAADAPAAATDPDPSTSSSAAAAPPPPANSRAFCRRHSTLPGTGAEPPSLALPDAAAAAARLSPAFSAAASAAASDERQRRSLRSFCTTRRALRRRIPMGVSTMRDFFRFSCCSSAAAKAAREVVEKPLGFPAVGATGVELAVPARGFGNTMLCLDATTLGGCASQVESSRIASHQVDKQSRTEIKERINNNVE